MSALAAACSASLCMLCIVAQSHTSTHSVRHYTGSTHTHTSAHPHTRTHTHLSLSLSLPCTYSRAHAHFAIRARMHFILARTPPVHTRAPARMLQRFSISHCLLSLSQEQGETCERTSLPSGLCGA